MSGANTIECPHCGAPNVVLAGAANKRWMCDACGGLIDLRDPADASGDANSTEADSGEKPDSEARPAKVHASRWMEGLTPGQQAAIREELASNPEILRNELARVRRETAAKAMGAGARSPLLRLIGGMLVLAGAFSATLPFVDRVLGELDGGDSLQGLLGELLTVSPPLAILLGLGLMVSGAALAFGRRWGAHASAVLMVFACFVFSFQPAVAGFALLTILALFATRKALE